MNSTFWNDGYRDGAEGWYATPPDVNVYAQEYLDGYKRGKLDRLLEAAKQLGKIEFIHVR